MNAASLIAIYKLSATKQYMARSKEAPAKFIEDSPATLCIRASIQNAFCGPHKVMRSPKLCDVADVTKVAPCGPGRSGRVREVGGQTYALLHNFMWFTQLLLN